MSASRLGRIVSRAAIVVVALWVVGAPPASATAPPPATACVAGRGQNNAPDKPATFGYATGGATGVVGLREPTFSATSPSVAHTGVYGLAVNGGGSGVQGQGPSTGVFGNATAASGAAKGAFGPCVSPAGNAVAGYNGAGSGDRVAGRFTTGAPAGKALIGTATEP